MPPVLSTNAGISADANETRLCNDILLVGDGDKMADSTAAPRLEESPGKEEVQLEMLEPDCKAPIHYCGNAAMMIGLGFRHAIE